ncbi:MAG: twin-arginine translocase TatA/TatE family subunit [Bryobacteraceae bacterium]
MFEGLFQPMHLLIILAVGVLVFGPKKIPELGKGLGEGIRGFKEALKSATEAPPPPAPTEVEKK